MSTATLGRDASGLLPLWRAGQVFRLASLAYATAVQWTVVREYDNQLLSWAVLALMYVWTGVSGCLLAFGYRLRRQIVIADVVVVLVLMSSTLSVGPASYFERHQTVPTTFWATNAVVSVAILLGPWWGMASGAVVGLFGLAVCGQLDNLRFDATVPILLTVGLVVGMGAQIVRRAREQIDRAIRLEAATAERERLTREVHDTTLQVLAFIARRSGEIGGPTSELGQLAADQERSLRQLLSRQAERAPVSSATDLRTLLEEAMPADVELAAPSEPVLLDHESLTQLRSVVLAILDNTAKHAGPGAKSNVLIEHLDDEVIVSVRDDGVGMDVARVQEAYHEGRMGISKSIQGRMNAVGGSAELFSAPGEGTEWELHLPTKGETNR